MTTLDTPAIGRKIKRLFHEDRAELIEALSAVSHPIWRFWARAWLLEIGVTDDATINATIPGIIFVWAQLVKEHNAERHHNPDRLGETGQPPAKQQQR